ncbi:hypothetical protein L249_6770 [Ophiocordyceps polyrhachis-furcata BCC 54312]|uniref:Uncharacterized protein n=1 Tax=Ophiocordyceps polyrhachis-furcata BCC 54312 TaxID=1330021 RepID=A0A367LL94_9HYPO|nr:hypothetical protein L249_6770 [Ophiocordyceps polyrhachis-furcata BCC 54312]
MNSPRAVGSAKVELQSRVHADDATNQVPIAVGTDPVGHDDARPGRADLELLGALALLAVLDAEVFERGRVDLCRDPLGPARGVEEVAGAEEVDEEGRHGRVGSVGGHAGQGKHLLGGPLELAAAKGDLLLDVLALGNLVKVLYAETAVAAVAVLAVVGPLLGVDGPAATVPAGCSHVVVQCEAADDDDLAAGLAQSRNRRLRPPQVAGLVYVGVLEVLCHLAVCGLSRPLALDAEEDGLGRVLVEEAVCVLEEIVEVLASRQGDGEDAVDERQRRFRRVGGDADVEEADAVA